MIGLGSSSIGRLPHGYVQTPRRSANDERRIAEQGFATARGHAMTTDDEARGFVIERLMCDFAFPADEVEAAVREGCRSDPGSRRRNSRRMTARLSERRPTRMASALQKGPPVRVHAMCGFRRLFRGQGVGVTGGRLRFPAYVPSKPGAVAAHAAHGKARLAVARRALWEKWEQGRNSTFENRPVWLTCDYAVANSNAANVASAEINGRYSARGRFSVFRMSSPPRIESPGKESWRDEHQLQDHMGENSKASYPLD